MKTSYCLPVGAEKQTNVQKLLCPKIKKGHIFSPASCAEQKIPNVQRHCEFLPIVIQKHILSLAEGGRDRFKIQTSLDLFHNFFKKQ